MSPERIAFIPGDSFVHSLNPLTKSTWLIVGTIAVFVFRHPWFVMISAGLFFFLLSLSGIQFGRIRGSRMFVITAVLLALLQIFFVQDGVAILELKALTITTGGIQAGIYVAGRFLAVIMLSYLFVMTTNPNDLAYSLMRVGLPYRFGFALITALRLVPTFEQEGRIVYNAQLARGVRYDVKTPRSYLILARQFVLPLLISALGKVDALAVSMDGRCFGKYPTRTFLRQTTITWRDGVALGLLTVSILVFCLSKIGVGGI